MPAVPTPSTFLFTDVAGSTRFWVEHPEVAGPAFARHDRILSDAVAGAGGSVVKGTGDGLMARFDDPFAALRASVAAQHMLLKERESLREAAVVRMAIATGAAESRDGDFFGLTVILCSRLMAAAHGGQILLSGSARDTIGTPPAPYGFVDLGRHRVKGLEDPQRVFQAVHPDLPDEFPPIASLPIARHNLPEHLTSFVGRRAELEEIDGFLHRHRLVTLTGSGGVGKTRLATRAAAGLLDEVADGVWFVDLTSLADGQRAAAAVAGAFGLAEQPGRPPAMLLAEHLAAKEALLVLDNCEHVLAPIAELTRHLLGRSPGLRILATSRERLGVPGEAVYRVSPMRVPTDAEMAQPGGLAEIDAVHLFVERAALTQPGFRLSASIAPAVAAICRRLDGIPLAIELAAAKAGAISPRLLADRLDERLNLLSRPGAGGDHRATLRATIDWSYQLLEPGERLLFERLSVFRGGFDIEAAEAVAGGLGQAGDGTLPTLLRLVEKSLVARYPVADRYGLLETLRHYAAERLADREGALGPTAARHARHYAALAEAARAEWRGPRRVDWLDRLAVEHDNLAAAIGHGLECSTDIAARIAAACWPFWKLRGHASAGRAWLGRILEDADGVEPDLHAELLLGAADLAIDRGDLSSAAGLLARARSIAQSHRDASAEAGIVAKLATIAHKAGDLDRAIGVAEEALALARRAGDDWAEGRVLCGLALLREDRGDGALAGTLAEGAVEASRRCGDPYLAGDAALSAGEIALNREEHRKAEHLFGEALHHAEEVGLADVRAWSLAYLGKLAVATGEARRARALLERALAEFEELETPMGAAWAHCQLGRALVHDREHLAARRHLDEALRLADRYVRPDAAQVIDVMALLALETGELERAATLTGAAEGLRRRFGLHRAEPEARSSAGIAARLAAALPADSLEARITRGRSMTDDEIVAFGLAR